MSGEGNSPDDEGSITASAPTRSAFNFPVDKYGRPGTWSAMAHTRSEWLAGDQSGWPLNIRVWFAAVSRASYTGHARFEAGELVRLLYANHDTGEAAKKQGSAVDAAIKVAVSRGLLDDRSRRGCLVLDGRLVQRGKGGKGVCGLPAHRDTA